MTQEEKELLLQDLSARLPYGVQVEIEGFHNGILRGIDGGTVSTDRGINYPLRYVKPYLRSMSTMTEEEMQEYVITWDSRQPYLPTEAMDWLNAHHFDYRGLISKGLALNAPEGMYSV